MPEPTQTHPREKEIYLEASALRSEAERGAFLDRACGEDEELRNRVESLLEAESEPSPFEPKPWVREVVEDLRQTSGIRVESGSSPTRNRLWEPPAAQDLDSLLDRYEVTSLLSCGGMGAVYKGIQTALERPVAIKILPPEFGDDPSFAKRFRREALAMAKLSHPNIVTVFDFGSVTTAVDGEEEAPREIFYFVMEFVDGTDLHHLIRCGELSTETALDVVGQICNALQYAHGHGYVHRDIKPANVFVTGDGVVKVGDFGLAKLTGDGDAAEAEPLTVTGYVVGTPDYLAPENLETGGQVDHRADIYSLGVIFYEMLTGSLPKGAFPPPSEKSGSDARLDEVVIRAMQSEPDRRYQQASEVKLDVDQISGTRISGAPPAKGFEAPDPRKPKAKKRQWPIWGGVGLALVAAFTFPFWGHQEPAPPDEDPPSPPVPAPKAISQATFPLPVPTRGLPDPATLPAGKVRVWGKAIGGIEMSVGDWGEVSDFVEVQLDGNHGWFGLRANGDVLRWDYYRDSTSHRIGKRVATLNRGADHHYGEWLSARGAIIARIHEDLGLRSNIPPGRVVDLAKSYPSGEYSILLDDGTISYLGTGSPPPEGVTDIVRIEAWTETFFGLRQSGEWVAWGKLPHTELGLGGLRIAKLVSNTFLMIALTTDGEIWDSSRLGLLSKADFPGADGPFIDVTCGYEIFAARRLDGTWLSWGSDKFAATIEKIRSLDPNVCALSVSGDRMVWLETEADP